MEKIKPILEMLKKNLFWIFCIVALGVTIATYFKVSANIAADQAKRETEIKGKFKLATDIAGKGIRKKGEAGSAVHPNASMLNGLTKLVDQERDTVREKWTELYANQQELLTWPKALSPHAVNAFKRFRPIESTIGFPPEPKVEALKKFRIAYQELVREELIDLAAKIGEVWLPTLQRTPRHKDNDKIVKATKDNSRVVFWNGTNQSYWENKFIDFQRPFNTDPNRVPLTLQVLYAQEDIWVLNSILEDIIKPTNGDVLANDLAQIKKIDHIYIGHDAQGINGNVYVAELAAVVDGVPASVSGLAANAPTTLTEGDFDPANGRYVNGEFEPLDAKTLRDSFTATNKDIAYLAIAKRIPVRIGLQMDERAIWDLLVNCANARLPLEVRQVRINTHVINTRGSLAAQFDALNTAAAQSALGLARSGGGGGTPMGSISSPEEVLTDTAVGFKEETFSVGGESESRGAYQIPVEIYGIIYLYNPPDKAIVSPKEQTAGAPEQGNGTS